MDPLFKHRKTGKLYRILCRHDTVGRDIWEPRALCQLALSDTPRVYSQDRSTDRTFRLKNLEPHS